LHRDARDERAPGFRRGGCHDRQSHSTRVPHCCTLALALSLSAEVALASAQRTFVASTGNDANTASNCSLILPCRSFAAAMTQTDVGGEIVVLDSAGYAPVTIDKSVSIIVPEGIYGGITAFAGSAVTITGTSLRVLLRGLTLNTPALPSRASIGVSVTASDSDIQLERVSISGFATFGISADSFSDRTHLRVQDSVIRAGGNGGINAGGGYHVVLNRVLIGEAYNGVSVFNSAYLELRESVIDGGEGSQYGNVGLYVDNVGSAVGRVKSVVIDHSSIRSFLTGVQVNAVGSEPDIALTVSNSVVSDNYSGIEVACSSSTTVQATVADSVVANNGVLGVGSGNGISVSGSACNATASHNVITGNRGTSMVNAGAGSFASFGDNRVRGNVTDTPSGTITAVLAR